MKRIKVLALFYVDVNANKGDSIRVRETARFMSKICDLQIICINAKSLKGVTHAFQVPRFRKFMSVAWNFLSFCYGIYACIKQKPTVIYADACPGSFSPIVLSILMRKPLVIEMHTPAGAQDVFLYRAKTSFHVKMAQWIERATVHRAKLVIASKGWADLVQQLYEIPHDRLLSFPLAINRSLFRPIDMKKCRNLLGLPENVPIGVFVGNLGPWQGLDTLLKAVPKALENFPAALFLIVGDGASRLDLIELSRELGVEHSVRFTGAVDYEKVPYYICAADVGFSLFPKDRGEKGGVSAHKTLNYLACGRPLIISEMDEMADLIAGHNAGKVIKPDDPQLLTEALLWIFRTTKGDDGELMRLEAASLGKFLPTWEDRTSKIMIHVGEII